MDNFSEKALIGRIIELRRGFAGERGRSKFAEVLGISPSTYSYYEKDRVPPIPILLKICQLCNVGIFWLLTGQQEGKSAENQPFDSRFKPVLEKIRRLSAKNPVSLQAVTAFLELMEQKNAIEGQILVGRTSDSGTRPGWIPVLGRTAAGTLGMWNETNLTDSKIMETKLEQLVARHIHSPVLKTQNGWISADLQAKPVVAALDNPRISLIQTAQAGSDEIYQFIDCPGIVQSYPDCFALQVDGDSMSPRINDSDMVIVSPSVLASQGQPAIVNVAGAIGVTCKLLRTEADRVHLVPINETYEPKIIKSEDLLWALAVLCHVKTEKR
jgi:SOS-response transcriptional repressor LexA/DNA-binding XRE family transcriptional regulator